MISDEAQLTYSAVLTPGEDGWVCAQIAEVTEAISQGRSVEEAKANVTETLELALAWRRDEGEALPARAARDGGVGHRRGPLIGLTASSSAGCARTEPNPCRPQRWRGMRPGSTPRPE